MNAIRGLVHSYIDMSDDSQESHPHGHGARGGRGGGKMSGAQVAAMFAAARAGAPGGKLSKSQKVDMRSKAESHQQRSRLVKGIQTKPLPKAGERASLDIPKASAAQKKALAPPSAAAMASRPARPTPYKGGIATKALPKAGGDRVDMGKLLGKPDKGLQKKLAAPAAAKAAQPSKEHVEKKSAFDKAGKLAAKDINSAAKASEKAAKDRAKDYKDKSGKNLSAIKGALGKVTSAVKDTSRAQVEALNKSTTTVATEGAKMAEMKRHKFHGLVHTYKDDPFKKWR